MTTAAALALLLAQMCVSEIGWQPQVTECVLMWEVTERNARRSNRTIKKQIHLYNAWYVRPERYPSRAWIAGLNLEGDEPEGWPENASWERARRVWLRYLRAARRYLDHLDEGRRTRLCPGAVDYGGRCEDESGACDTPQNPCLRPVTCLQIRTKQRYWARGACGRR